VAPRTLVVWCPYWPVTAAGIPPGQAAVVVQSNLVVAASEAALHHGIRPGLRRREAQARCPGVAVVERQAGQEAASFERVVAALAELTPEVVVLQPGECALATRGPSRYHGGEAALVRLVCSAVAQALGTGGAGEGVSGPRWRVGVADGLFAARQAARRAEVVPEGKSAGFLARLPVACLGRPELADLLVRLGVRTLGHLARLPEPAVAERFGPDGLLCHRLARGLDAQPLATAAPAPDLSVGTELDPPADRGEAVAFLARALAGELCQRLDRMGLACTRLRVDTETGHGQRLSRLWVADLPLTPAAVAERVRWQVEGWAAGGQGGERPTAGLVGLRLAAEEAVPAGAQPSLWAPSCAGSRRAEQAIARLQQVLGAGGVLRAVPTGGRSPADQLLVPWGSPLPQPSPAPWPGQVPPPSPAAVHPEPLPARLEDPSGQPVQVSGRGSISGPPCLLRVRGWPPGRVGGWAGPWPIEERWWDPASRSRRARLQVGLEDGSAHLLELEAGAWRVAASYD
jgi:protein ImuB